MANFPVGYDVVWQLQHLRLGTIGTHKIT